MLATMFAGIGRVRIGSDSDFLPLIGLAVKAGTRRERTESGRRLKTTHADFLYKQRRRVCTMNHRKAGKPAPNPMEQGEIDRLEAPAENQGRLVDPDQASGGEAHPGFGHVQSGHRQQAYAAAT